MASPCLQDIVPEPFELDATGGVRFPALGENPSAQSTRPLICVLSGQGFLAMRGPGAQTFMQGQFTCDLRRIDLERSSPGCHCTPKGRAIATFQLAQLDAESFLLQLPAPMCEPLRLALAKYIVFSKAELTPASDDWLALGLSGGPATELVAEYFGRAPAEANAQVLNAEGLCYRVAGPGERYVAWLRRERAAAFWSRASASLEAADAEAFALLDIRAGLAQITEATSDQFLPQMLDLDGAGGVSFNKGCYTGQEVIARAHYRGAVKRHLHRITGTADPCPAPGAPIYGDGRPCGTLVACVAPAAGEIEGLAVLREAADGVLSLSPAAGGDTIRSQPLPTRGAD